MSTAPPPCPAPGSAAATPQAAPWDFFFSKLQPPSWLVDELQNRLLLLLNHVLQQESQAQARLLRQKGRVASVEWRLFAMNFVVTPAGLLALADAAATPDLRITVAENSPLALLRHALSSEKPPVQIQGDVQFAAEINWLVDHVRWDIEEDLAGVLGDAPAHALAQAGHRAAQALRRFAAPRPAPAAAPAPPQATSAAPAAYASPAEGA